MNKIPKQQFKTRFSQDDQKSKRRFSAAAIFCFQQL